MCGNILTPDFWKEVDRLASQTTALLLPLINLQGKLVPDSNWPRLVAIHQELHNIIAHAGYLAICMSWSRSVFRITFPEPGQLWDADQNHLDNTIHDGSKKAATAHDLAKVRAAEKPATRPPFRVAKVKIAVWPLVQRFKPLTPAEGYGSEGGEKITTVMKSQVVFYAGLLDGASEMAERGPLAQHVRQARWQASYLHPRALLIGLIRLLVLLLLILAIFLLLHSTGLVQLFDFHRHRVTFTSVVRPVMDSIQRTAATVTRQVRDSIQTLVTRQVLGSTQRPASKEHIIIQSG